jgi:hypothetical protein
MSERMFKFLDSVKSTQFTETLPKVTVRNSYKLIPFSRLVCIYQLECAGETGFKFIDLKPDLYVKETLNDIQKMIESDVKVIELNLI